MGRGQTTFRGKHLDPFVDGLQAQSLQPIPQEAARLFGEDFDPDEQRNNSDGSIQTANTLAAEGSRDRDRGRQSSATTRAESPGPSRPKTPVPSSEVTPWVFQDPPKVSTSFAVVKSCSC